jgi:hypothetical protein
MRLLGLAGLSLVLALELRRGFFLFSFCLGHEFGVPSGHLGCQMGLQGLCMGVDTHFLRTDSLADRLVSFVIDLPRVDGT